MATITHRIGLSRNLTAAEVDANFDGLNTGKADAGTITYVDVVASRDYSSATDKGKVLRCSPAGSSFTITVQTTSGQAAGDLFATSKTAAGTLTVAAGAGITLNDNAAKQAAQAAHDFPLAFQFETIAIVNVG